MNKKNGFTLIELVITLAIIGIVIPMVFTPIIYSFKNFNTQNEKAKVISDVRATMDHLTREIRKFPDGVIVEDEKITINGVTYIEENGISVEGKRYPHEESETMEKIDIVVAAKYSENKIHKLSSTIHIR